MNIIYFLFISILEQEEKSESMNKGLQSLMVSGIINCTDPLDLDRGLCVAAKAVCEAAASSFKWVQMSESY
jgi:hypothetical protein